MARVARVARSVALALALGSLALAGCGGSDDEGAGETTVDTATETSAADSMGAELGEQVELRLGDGTPVSPTVGARLRPIARLR